MQILFLAAHLPYPPISGGRRREYELLTRIGQRCTIHLCCVSKTYPEDQDYLPHLLPYCSTVTLFPVTEPDPAPQIDHPFPYQVRRHQSRETGAFVARTLADQHVDLVHVEGYYLMQHLPAVTRIPILLAEQNIEYLLYQQRMLLAPTAGERERYANEYRRTLEWEWRAWRRATMCAVVTEDDRHHMLERAPELNVALVPDGADHLPIVPATAHTSYGKKTLGSPDGFTILFPGNFAYEPNVDAARYLVHDIFPQIRQEVPAAHLLLVGNAPPPEILALANQPQISVTGRVPSLTPFFEAADIIVCPLRIGGGIKVKILEALQAGKAIVSSPIGVQGLGYAAHEAIAVAADPIGFAARVIQLLQQPAERMRLQEAARQFARQLPTWDNAAAALMTCYEQLVSTE